MEIWAIGHDWNAYSPIEVMLSGRVMSDSEVQFTKVFFSMLVTPCGMVMSLRDEHQAKASLPMPVILLDRVTLVNDLQP